MTKPPSPFAGVKLSDLVSKPSLGPLDQQLFRPAPPPTLPVTLAQPDTPQHVKDVKTQRRQDSKASIRQSEKTPMGQDSSESSHQDVKTSRPKDANGSRLHIVSAFNINDETFERETVRVTKTEQRAIEQLKLSLRDLLDSTVGKNDIFRAGLHFLLEDFQTNGEQSEIVARLRKKTS